MIAGGHSNLTFAVDDTEGHRRVLRRPPLSHGLASAHDMGREHRIIAALSTTSVPVPTALGFCDDETVNGAPFYVMDFVDGHVIRDVAEAEAALTPEARATASRSLVDTMVAIHSVDLDAVGLADLARHEDYLARQLRRWYGQWNQQRTRDPRALHRRPRRRARMAASSTPSTQPPRPSLGCARATTAHPNEGDVGWRRAMGSQGDAQ